MSTFDTYRHWRVAFEYGRWEAVHEDFDAEYCGPEEGWVGSHPTLTANSRDELMDEIDGWYDQHEV